MRIERILDETRELSTGLSRGRRALLLASGLTLVYGATVLHVAPAVAQESKPAQTRQAPSPPDPAPSPQPARPAPRAPRSEAKPKPEAAPKPEPAPEPASPAEPEPQAPPPLTLIHRVEPELPRIAKQVGARGNVDLAVKVGIDGHVIEVRVLRGHPMLQNAAIAAVKQWIYTPPPVETNTTVTLSLGDDQAPAPMGQLLQAVLISRKEPVLPEAARAAGISGQVLLEATIGTDGHVKSIRVLRGDPLLAGAAEEAVRQWAYRPTMLNGTPVETKSQIVLNFVGDRPAAPPAVEGFERAELISRTEPVHPGGELLGLEGTVRFRARIGADGKLLDIQVADGPAELVSAALEAVKQWRYRPARLNGRPVEAETQIALRFTPGH